MHLGTLWQDTPSLNSDSRLGHDVQVSMDGRVMTWIVDTWSDERFRTSTTPEIRFSACIAAAGAMSFDEGLEAQSASSHAGPNIRQAKRDYSTANVNWNGRYSWTKHAGNPEPAIQGSVGRLGFGPAHYCQLVRLSGYSET